MAMSQRARVGLALGSLSRPASTSAGQLAASTVHILGIGNIGKLVAHSLAKKESPPPVTLLFHRPGLLKDWERSQKCIELITNGQSDKQYGFSTELIPETAESATSPTDMIKNLVIATKAMQTSQALAGIRHRLDNESTILFTQNGMGKAIDTTPPPATLTTAGIMEEVTSKVFPDSQSRPKYLSSIFLSHGVYSNGPFSSTHAGQGTVVIGDLSSSPPSTSSSATPQGPDPTQPYLLTQLLSATALKASTVPEEELFQIRIEKLIANCMINPLSVLFRRKNGDLFSEDSDSQIYWLMETLISEACLVLNNLPEIQELPDWHLENGNLANRTRFGRGKLQIFVEKVAKDTAENKSSMLQDVLEGRETEIDYLNGWIVEKGKEVDFECKWNKRIVEMVKEGKVITEWKGDISNTLFPEWKDDRGDSAGVEFEEALKGLKRLKK